MESQSEFNSMVNLPVVSVVVVTYNSSKYVIETLESILSQTYTGDIELLISDDGSQDNTVDICRKWIDINGDVFLSANIIITPKNLGICGNYNYALEHVKGEWIKYIAGDDILEPFCIETFVKSSLSSSDKFFISGVNCFETDSSIIRPRYLMENYLDDTQAFIQAENLAKFAGYGIIEGPSFFINTIFLRSMGGMDTYYPMLEDFPFAFKCAFLGYHIGVIKKPLIRYRIYPESISQSKEEFKNMYQDAVYSARIKVAKRNRHFLEAWHYYIMKRLIGYPSLKSIGNFMSFVLKISDLYAHIEKFTKYIMRWRNVIVVGHIKGI